MCNIDDQHPKVCCPSMFKLKYGPLFPPDCGIPIQDKKTKTLNDNRSNTVINILSRISGGESAKLGKQKYNLFII